VSQNTIPFEGDDEAERLARDELNLIQFPFALLADRPAKDGTLIRTFTEGEKRWIVEGSPLYGLPTASDLLIYVALLELTRQQRYPETVTFSRYELCHRLGWPTDGRHYRRLTDGLHRLAGVRIHFRESFYDKRLKRTVSSEGQMAMLSFATSEADEQSLFPSAITWHPWLRANMQAGHINVLDVTFFLSLDSAIARALYRFLDAKRHDGKPTYRIGLQKLAFERLGMAGNYNNAQIKRRLDPAHEELQAKAFLAGWEYALMKSGEPMVVYQFARSLKPSPNEPSAAVKQICATVTARLEWESYLAGFPDDERIGAERRLWQRLKETNNMAWELGQRRPDSEAVRLALADVAAELLREQSVSS
jgi:plasmid replication initiation protein